MTKLELPQGWAVATVDDLGEYINGCAFKPTDWGETGTPIVRIQNLTDANRVLNRTNRTVDEKYVISNGDLLASWSATLDVFKWMGEKAYVNQHIFKVVPNLLIDRGFVRFALKFAIEELINSEHLHGTTMKHINRGPFLAHEVYLPPLAEQERIVEKIEMLFAELDKSEEVLRSVQKLLARYRQSVLKAAVTGTLTADWRAAHPALTETGHDLLTRILAHRREMWKGRSRYVEPPTLSVEGLAGLPEGWVWTSLGSLISSGPQNGLYLPQSQYGSGTPILRIDDYQVDWLRPMADLRQVAANEADSAKYALAVGDIVVNRVNSVSHLGKSTLIGKGHAGTLFESNMMRFVPTELASAEYIAAYLGSEFGRKLLIKNCKHAVNQASINQGDVEATPIPLPPRAEQDTIAERILEEKQRAKAALDLCISEQSRSAALRQSILKDAFAGKLVQQDPNDEPASELLARIRTSRMAAPKRTRRKAMA